MPKSASPRPRFETTRSGAAPKWTPRRKLSIAGIVSSNPLKRAYTLDDVTTVSSWVTTAASISIIKPRPWSFFFFFFLLCSTKPIVYLYTFSFIFSLQLICGRIRMILRLRVYRLLLKAGVYFISLLASYFGWILWRIACECLGRPTPYVLRGHISHVLFGAFVWALMAEHYKVTSFAELFRGRTGARRQWFCCWLSIENHQGL